MSRVSVLKRNILVRVIIFFLFFLVANISYCDDQVDEDKAYTREVGFFTGWAEGNLKKQDDYRMVPLYLQIGFDVKPLLSKIHIEPKGMMNFILEPFLNTIVSPNSNVEVGCDFILKYRHPIAQKFQVYFELGLGLLFTSQHTTEQSTQFNFTEQAGAGISYFFSKNKSINVGYRYRHFSNASIKEPNDGVDMDYILCGISIFY